MNSEVFCEFRLDSAHYLPTVPEGHKCRRVHGHGYRIVVTITSEIDPKTGWIFDYAELEKIWVAKVHDTLDHRLLNDVLGEENTTSERIAVWIGLQVDQALPVDVRVKSVEVWETAAFGARWIP